MSYRPSRRPDISYGSYQPDYPNVPSIKPIPAPTFNTGRLPAGGGRLDPLMAREPPTRYGSYPPRSTTREELIPTREHSIRSYNQNSYGDFSPSRYPRPSTAPMYDDPGYKREPGFPDGSRMERQHASYKADHLAAGAATKSYTKEAAKLAVVPTKVRGATGPVKNKYYHPQDHATLGSLADRAVTATKTHAEARKEFNHDHIGRVPRRTYNNHRTQADMAAASHKNMTEYEKGHRHFAGQSRFP